MKFIRCKNEYLGPFSLNEKRMRLRKSWQNFIFLLFMNFLLIIFSNLCSTNSENLSQFFFKLESLGNHRERRRFSHKLSVLPNSKNIKNSLRIKFIVAYNLAQENNLISASIRELTPGQLRTFLRSFTYLYIQDSYEVFNFFCLPIISIGFRKFYTVFLLDEAVVSSRVRPGVTSFN